MKCDSCDSMSVNGVFIHEKGCPNEHSRYDERNKEWVNQIILEKRQAEHKRREQASVLADKDRAKLLAKIISSMEQINLI